MILLNYISNAYNNFGNKKYIFSENIYFTFAEIINLALDFYLLFNIKVTNKPIAIILPRNHLSIIAFFATWFSRNFYVPLDPELPSERINSILEELSCPLIIIDGSKPSNFNLNKNSKSNILDISLLNLTTSCEIRDLNKLLKNYPHPIDPAYCIYTSGSTGKPKGVLISHRSLVSYILWFVSEFKLSKTTCFGNMSQLYFDISNVDIYTPLITKGSTYFIPQKAIKFPIDTIKFINEKKINSVMWVPSALTSIARSNALETLVPNKLRNIFFAGEQLSIKVYEYWKGKFPLATFVNLYGPTEATITCAHYTIPNQEKFEKIPIGYPSNSSKILLLDFNENELKKSSLIKKSDTIGEIFIGGECLSLGYWKNFELTNQKFINNPHNADYQDKIYRTGDLGKYDENGRLIFIGRNDSQIKFRGYRIELGDIEAATESIESVSKCCAFFLDSTSLLAIAVESTNKLLNKADVFAALKNLIPSYMIPKKILIIAEFPLTETGKIDKLKLKKVVESSINERNPI
jgi:D-alanine--poly(phosphoribitol) ligase subunit 1